MIYQKSLKEYIKSFYHYLLSEERAEGTVKKYIRDVETFASWLGNRKITKDNVASWKAHLIEQGLQPVTINSKIAALNGFLRFMGLSDHCAKFLRIQKRLFRDVNRELSKGEYLHLVETARSLGKERLALLIESICSTGIRVSEVKYLTVEAVRQMQARVALKGKVRTIMIPSKLCKKLLIFAKKNKIASGELFVTESGKRLSRGQIWLEMKKLSAIAGIEASKVFPHNLRHLFASVFYKACKDIARLADVLGHSSIETTRIYLISSAWECSRELERMKLIC